MGKSRNKIEYNGKVFTHEQIKNGNCYLACSLLSDSLEANTLEFDIASEDTTLTEFERNTPVTYYRDDMQVGIFYLQSVERTGIDTYHFMANSAIGLLMEGQHMGGIYIGQHVKDVLPSICGTIPYYIKSDLKEIPLYGWLPIASPRDNLSQVLFAIGATVKTDLDGALRIENLWDGLSGYTGKSQMYTDAKIEYASKVTRVIVTEHQYVDNSDLWWLPENNSEPEKLFEGTAQQGDIITFQEPMHHLTASGFEILESGANYAKLSAGSGVLTGRKYIHNTRQISKNVSEAREENVKIVKDATLISLINSEAVANRLVNFYRCIETINAADVYHGEIPGNVVSTYHAYDKKQAIACVQTADINMSNVLKSQEKSLVGFTPIKDENAYNMQSFLTGSGTWMVPDGVTSLHVVLIGAGQNGEDGENGHENVGGSYDFAIPIVEGVGSKEITLYNNTLEVGCTGGKGGKGGLGGKIYETTIEVEPGSEIRYNCGINSANPTDTVFGSLTSGNGTRSEVGYVDLNRNIRYAMSGIDGYDGGYGGDAGKSGEPSSDETKGGDGISGKTLDSEKSFSIYNPYSQGINQFTIKVKADIGGAGGGGGGGSGGGAQTRGIRGFSAEDRAGIVFNEGSSSGASVAVMIPGIGGNASGGVRATTYGSGGGGGGGGGGAGGLGKTRATFTVEGTQIVNQFPVTLEILNTGAIQGSYGGAGGAGMPGCIILYYNKPVKEKSGPVVGREGLLFLTRHARRFVV